MADVLRKVKSGFALFRRAFGAYRWQIAGMAFLSFVSGALEGVGVNAIIPLFSLVDNGATPTTDAISTAIRDFIAATHLNYSIRTLLIFICALFIVKAVVLFFAQYITARIIADYERRTRGEILRATLHMDWGALSKQKVGYLDQLLTTDVSTSSAMLFYLSSTTLMATNLLVYSLVAVNVSPAITLFALALGGIMLLLFKPLFYKSRIISAAFNHEQKELAHFANEQIIGMKAIKSLHVEQGVFNKGFSRFERLRALYLSLVPPKTLTNVLVPPVGVFFILATFAFFYKTAAFNFASFAVIVYAINKVFANIQIAQAHLHVLNSQIPYLVSVLRYEDEAAAAEEQDSGDEHFSFAGQLEFRNVTFSYGADREALSDVSFTIRKNAMVGFIGPSGSGKTTLVDLLLRLLRPQQGVMYVDEVEASRIRLREWRDRIGYVSQDIFLLNDTIAANIRFYDERVNDERMREAAKFAHIDEFVEGLPRGYDTVVGERGVALSGGQRQRIVLARILARRPELLILDEATSALDNESEAAIQKSIEELRGKLTVIIIAHRLSTVLVSDRLIALHGGKVIEEGEPQELLKNPESYFYKMHKLQQ